MTLPQRAQSYQQLAQRTYSRIVPPQNKNRIASVKAKSITGSFRRKARAQSTPKQIKPVCSNEYPISKKTEDKITFILRIASLHKVNLLPLGEAKRLSERIVSNIYNIDSYLGRKGENPSILFTIFRHEPSRRREITSLLSLVAISKTSTQRDGLVLGLALNLAPYSKRFAYTFQDVLQMLLSRRHPRRDEIARHFIRRKFNAPRIKYSSAQLIQWLCNVVASTRSLNYHLPLIARIIRTWNSGPVPLQVIHSLIWMYIPRTLDSDFAILERRYRIQVTNVSTLSYTTLISLVTHTFRRSDPMEVDALLIQTFIRHLIETDRFLYAISVFDALKEIKLESNLSSDTLLMFLKKLIETQNYEEAIHTYSALLRSRLLNEQKVKPRLNHTPEQVHITFVLQHTHLFVELLRGLRKSNKSQEYVIELLAALPAKVITRNHNLAAEMLRYAGSSNNRNLVHTILNALHHPLYDESFDPHDQPSNFQFSAEMWSAILYSHVQLGLINSSRLILQSMQQDGLQPRSEDVSAIVCGVTKFDLESGFDLAIKLSESLNLDSYETILEIAIELDNTKIMEWARNLVAYESPKISYITADEELLSPTSYEMKSELSIAMENASLPTCTPRAKSLIIKQTATKNGIASAILQLINSEEMPFQRDVYDGLYDIAFDSGQLQYAMWIANEMRSRGWMPRDYRALKNQVQYHFLKGLWTWL